MPDLDPEGVARRRALVRSGRQVLASPVTQRWLLPLLVGGIATILSWPTTSRILDTGPDPSWVAALHLAAADRLRFGSDLAFTYGPLGWLGFPAPVFGATSTLAFLAMGAFQTVTLAVVFVHARRAVPIVVAAFATLFVGRVLLALPAWETLQVLAFVVLVDALAGRIRVRPAAIVVGAGLVAGFALLGKLNVAVFIAAMAGLASLVLLRPWWRGPLVFGAVTFAVAVILWLAAGQDLADIPAYLATGYGLIAGYSEAMVADRDPSRTLLTIGLFAVAAAAVLVLATSTARRGPRPAGAAIVAITLILLFAEWKTAVTRPYPGYSFTTLFLASFAFLAARVDGRADRPSMDAANPSTPSSRRTRLPGRLDQRLGWLAVATGMLVAVAIVSPFPDLLGVVRSASTFVRDARSSLPPRGVAAADARTRQGLRDAYALSPAIVQALAGHRVHVEPTETGVIAAYADALTWSPLPYFQSYFVWTEAQDLANVEQLDDPSGPDRILREARFRTTAPPWLIRQLGRPIAPGDRIAVTIDGRYRWFEEPATTLRILCTYRELVATERWQVVGRAASSCGGPVPLASVEAAEGETVQVPVPPDAASFVIVRIRGISPSVGDRLTASLFRGREWFVTVDGLRYRLVPGTAAEGLLLAVPTGADGTGSFAFGPAIRALSVEAGLDGIDTGRTLTFEFLSVPYEGAGRAVVSP